jgi:hypothetical protein
MQFLLSAQGCGVVGVAVAIVVFVINVALAAVVAFVIGAL